MGWFIPIVTFAGRTIYRKPILSAAGGILAWEFFDADGSPVGEWTESQVSGALSQLANAGVEGIAAASEAVVSGLGEAIPEIIERIGPSFIKGINNTVAALREELRGSEVKVLTTFLTALLAWATLVYVMAWVRGAGETAHVGV